MAAFAFTALVAFLALAAQTTLASPLTPRGTIPHDQVQPFPEAVTAGVSGQLYLRHKPYLRVDSGCVPFPAVDKNGNTRSVCNSMHSGAAD